jgi:hypothetical protein
MAKVQSRFRRASSSALRMTSTAAFIARLLGLLAAAVATLAFAVGLIGLPSTQGAKPAAGAHAGMEAAIEDSGR